MAELLGHPRGLFVCFATELWERFSYYGMRALLIYYLTQHFLFTDARSYAIYGAYTALTWGLPVIGGIIADRYAGPQRAVKIGAILLSTGHLLLAVEGPLNLFFLSLALIASGVGFLKSSISTLVGDLYERTDPRRDAGFTIFYLGINIGSFISPILCGWLGHAYGWSYGFGLAGIGMLAGLFVFIRGQKHLPPDRSEVRRPWTHWLMALAMVIVAWQLLQYDAVVGVFLGVSSAILGAAILYFSFARCTREERDRMLVVLVLIAFAILFWSFYQQSGSSLSLFSDRLVDRNLFGLEIQASQLQSLPALFVILFAPLFSLAWSALGRRGAEPNAAVKFSLGLLFMGLALMMPVTGATLAQAGERIGLIWFALTFFFMVCGELCIAPVAMSVVTRLCPARVVGMMMGAYFLSLSIGSYIAGHLATLTNIETQAGQVIAPGEALPVYISAYTSFGWTAILAALVLFALSPLLSRRMHADK
jgi:proton-dependent oligopeptide transporter, POT family